MANESPENPPLPRAPGAMPPAGLNAVGRPAAEILLGAFESMAGMIYVCSRDHVIEYMNEGMIRHIGRDATGEKCYSALHGLSGPCPWCVNDRVFAGQTVRWEVKSPKEGRWHYVVDSPLRRGDGTIAKQSVIIDITERKAAEEALRASEKRYQVLADISPVGIMHADTQGNCTYVNRMACEQSGRDSSQLLGQGWRQIVHPEERAEWVRSWGEAVARQQPFEGQMRVVRPDGSQLWTLVRFVPEPNDTGTIVGYVGTMTDITEHKLFEAELRKVNDTLEQRAAERGVAAELRARELADSEAALRRQTGILQSVLESMNDAVVVRDTAGALILSNRAAERLLGAGASPARPNSGLLANGVRDGLSNAPIRFDDLPSSRAARGEVLDNTELLLKHPGRPEGVWLSVNAAPLRDESGAITGGVSVVHDITLRKQAEESLRRQTAILRSVLDSMNDGVIVRDEAERLVLCNPAAEMILGTAMTKDRPFFPNPAVEVLDGRTNQPLVTEDAPFTRIGHRESIYGLELLIKHPARPAGVWVSLNAAPLAEGSAMRGGVVVFRDITAAKLAEQSLRESEHHYRDLAESNRRLLMELHHRVRNNLGGLLGLVEAMREKTTDVPTFAGAITARLTAMAHVHHILEAARWQSLDLKPLVQSLLIAVDSLAPHRIPVEIDGPNAHVSPRKVLPLAMVLTEWFTNSSKYGAHTSPSGHLTIAWRLVDRDQSKLVRLKWKETGGPPIAGPTIPSLGTELVRGFATTELRGQCDLTFPAEGADHTLEFPIE